MSITRAFTTRRVKQSLEAAEEAKVQRRSSNAGARIKISAPMELIHTTNMLSYNAPDIFPRKVSDMSTASTTSPSSASTKSDEDSDAHTVASTPPTSPDVPFLDLRVKVEANHLSSYFTAPVEEPAQKPLDRIAATRTGSVRAAIAKMEAPPAIPQRSPSHTKKSSETPSWIRSPSTRLSEQSARSTATKTSSTFSRVSSGSTNTSTTSRSSASPSHAPKVSTSSISAPIVPPMPSSTSQIQQHRKQLSGSRHPFGQELAQVSELAEEFSTATKAEISAASRAMQEEEQELRSRGLLKFSADDYMSDIRGLANLIFGEARSLGPVWI